MGERKELVAAVAASEPGPPQQEPSLSPGRNRRVGEFGNDARSLVRDPHELAPARFLGKRTGERSPILSTHVGEYRRMQDDEGRLGRNLGEQVRKVGDEIAATH